LHGDQVDEVELARDEVVVGDLFPGQLAGELDGVEDAFDEQDGLVRGVLA
jgi:hypothetical protein